MASLFTQGVVGSDDGADGGPIRQTRESAMESSFGVAPRRSRVIFPYNAVNAAMGKAPRAYVTSNARMDQHEVTATIAKLLKNVGLAGEREEVRHTFVEQLWLCYAVNSASAAMPGRAKIMIEGGQPIYFYGQVMVILGADARRFFRSVADEVAITVRDLLAREHVASDDERETIVDLRRIALSKGLQRLPHLAFDAAEYCSVEVVPVSDMAVVMQAKANSLPFIENPVDAIRAEQQMMAEAVNRAGGGAATKSFAPPAGSGGFAP